MINSMRDLAKFIERRLIHARSCPVFTVTTAAGALMGSGQGPIVCNCGLDSAIAFPRGSQ